MLIRSASQRGTRATRRSTSRRCVTPSRRPLPWRTPASMGFIDDVWYGDSLAAGMARLALWPLSAAFGAVSAARTLLYDEDILHAERPLVKTLSVGNLTVGGTGKTPIAAWLADRLSR